MFHLIFFPKAMRFLSSTTILNDSVQVCDPSFIEEWRKESMLLSDLWAFQLWEEIKGSMLMAKKLSVIQNLNFYCILSVCKKTTILKGTNLKWYFHRETCPSQASTKMESTLLVPEKLTFSENLRCLNFPLWTFWPAKTKKVKESNLFWDKAPTRSGKFKHLKFSKNVNFAGTNSVDSILVVACISSLVESNMKP